MGDQPVARPLLVHKHRKTHTQTLNIYVLSEIQTHGPGFQASEDSALFRPRRNVTVIKNGMEGNTKPALSGRKLDSPGIYRQQKSMQKV
jgi:hypothetical protein